MSVQCKNCLNAIKKDTETRCYAPGTRFAPVVNIKKQRLCSSYVKSTF